ncbi:unnamed protein product [Danaus chrysippus]|uniref:(African queen) hypothetical protein n=1 Tax=Danaus chrysippus TaxID=151541 RepID=A0A8J2R1K0_9NEOP|nr:unnamed protein product [Danaus chrysippus]
MMYVGVCPLYNMSTHVIIINEAGAVRYAGGLGSDATHYNTECEWCVCIYRHSHTCISRAHSTPSISDSGLLKPYIRCRRAPCAGAGPSARPGGGRGGVSWEPALGMSIGSCRYAANGLPSVEMVTLIYMKVFVLITSIAAALLAVPLIYIRGMLLGTHTSQDTMLALSVSSDAVSCSSLEPVLMIYQSQILLSSPHI